MRYIHEMRYLFAVIADKSVEVHASPDEARAIDAFNEKLEASRHRIIAVGVASPSHAKLFDNRDGSELVIDRPAVDSNLFMSGFWVIEAENDSIAFGLASEASRACNRMIEVRPLL